MYVNVASSVSNPKPKTAFLPPRMRQMHRLNALMPLSRTSVMGQSSMFGRPVVNKSFLGLHAPSVALKMSLNAEPEDQECFHGNSTSPSQCGEVGGEKLQPVRVEAMFSRLNIKDADRALLPEIDREVSKALIKSNYAPVSEEVTQHQLAVMGTIPRELSGLYVRNGPNLDEDVVRHIFLGKGMLHGVRIENGEAKKYLNRYVDTGTDRVQDGLSNVALIYFNQKLLSLGEIGLPQEIDLANLSTIGPYDFDGTLKINVGAHPKIADDGSLYGIGNDIFKRPSLSYFKVDSAGQLQSVVSIDSRPARMVHDFAITDNYAIFYDLPVEFDMLSAAVNGVRGLFGMDQDLPFRWNERGISRLGIRGKDDVKETTTWIDIPQTFIFHTVNAFEQEGKVVLDVVSYEHFFKAGADDLSEPGKLTRYIIDLNDKKVSIQSMEHQMIEFPQINPKYVGKPYRYSYSLKTNAMCPNGIMKYDLEQGQYQTICFKPHHCPGEFVFVAAKEGCDEDDGYLMGYVYDDEKKSSALWIFDAQSFGQEPLAIVDVGVRIPAGFHGLWVGDEQVQKSLSAATNSEANPMDKLADKMPLESTVVSKSLASSDPMRGDIKGPEAMAISRFANSLPRPVIEQVNVFALARFKANNPKFSEQCEQMKQHLASLGDQSLFALSQWIAFPEYYREIIHLAEDGINNGPVSTIQAAGAHGGLYKHNKEIRSTFHGPALTTAQNIIQAKGQCRIAVMGSGIGRDATDFLEWVMDKDPDAIKKMKLDLFDLSPSFIDGAAFEVPRVQHELGLTELGLTGTAYERISTLQAGQYEPQSQSVNQHQIGYSNPNAVIENIRLKDISADDFIESLESEGFDQYDLVFCPYVFHEMPEANIKSTMANLKKMSGKPVIFMQDMDYEEKMARYQRDGLKGQLGSLFYSGIFAATEPFVMSPPSTEIKALLQQYGTVTELPQSETTRKEASIQAFKIEPN